MNVSHVTFREMVDAYLVKTGRIQEEQSRSEPAPAPSATQAEESAALKE